MNKKKWIIGISACVILAIIPFSLKTCKENKQGFSFETVTVKRGNVSNTVTATGTIQAIKTVAVGTQVSGVVSKIYADFNSHVKKGQLLAEIDKAPLLSNLENAQAALDNAKAELTFQTSTYTKSKALYDKNLIAQSDYDQALYNYKKAEANMVTAKTGYEKSKINLDYASIYSPIDGVVLNRAVDEGQTVAASFSTPTLFSIANDLTQMQVEANIDEADIGQIRQGQKVDFTVDAFPELKFVGEITQIRLQPITTNNVVTYTVIVKAPNPDMKLMPGMTANITAVIEDAKDILTVPANALRFKPDSALIENYRFSLPEKERASLTAKPALPNEKQTLIWVKKGNNFYSIPVVVGISDGITSELKSGVAEGEEIIISMEATTDAAKKAASSPFMPKRPGSSTKK